MKEFITQYSVIELKELIADGVADGNKLLLKQLDLEKEEDEIVAFPDGCERIKQSKPSVYKLIKEGKLDSFTIHSRRYFLKSELDRFINELKNSNS